MPISTSRAFRGRALAAAVLLALTACSSSTEPLAEGDASVSTDHVVYVIGDAGFVEVRYTFHNRHPGSAYLSGCGGQQALAAVERERDGGWTQYMGVFCTTNLEMVGVPVPAGGSREGAVRIGEPGRYRLRIEYGTGIERILRGAVSPAFTVAH